MTEPTRHTYTFDLPDEIDRKIEAVFDLIPDPKAPMINVIGARIVEGPEFDEEFVTLLETVQDYLDDGGYDAAVAFARSNQPWVDWE